MNAIEPWMWVESMDTASDGTDRIVSGEVYQVRAFTRHGDARRCGYCGFDDSACTPILLTTDISERGGWCAKAFKPIYRPRADLIERLLAPVPENITVRALNPDRWPAVPEDVA